jgi:hypothetical protein
MRTHDKIRLDAEEQLAFGTKPFEMTSARDNLRLAAHDHQPPPRLAKLTMRSILGVQNRVRFKVGRPS